MAFLCTPGLQFYGKLTNHVDVKYSKCSYYKAIKKSSTVVSKNIKDNRQSDDSLGKTKSYSLTDLNMDYLYSNRLKNLPGDAPIELVIKELSILHRKRILQGKPNKTTKT